MGLSSFWKKKPKKVDYSFGEHPDNDALLLIKIDSGEFIETVLSISKVSVKGERNLSVNADILYVPEGLQTKYSKEVLKRKLDSIIMYIVSDTI